MSPEDQRVWEEDAETEYAEAHTQARPATHGPADAEKASQEVGEVERARVAWYAEAICRASRVVDVPEWIRIARFDLARAAITVADSELVSMAAENGRLRARVGRLGVLWQQMGREADREMLRAESAEAEVERLRVRLAKVEALADEEEAKCLLKPPLLNGSRFPAIVSVADLRAALADAPTEQTKGGE